MYFFCFTIVFQGRNICNALYKNLQKLLIFFGGSSCGLSIAHCSVDCYIFTNFHWSTLANV